MSHRKLIQVNLVKLSDGNRLMRLTYPPSGLVLEKKMDPKKAISRQKEALFSVFEAAITQAELAAA